MSYPGFAPITFTAVLLTGGALGNTRFDDVSLGGVNGARITSPNAPFSITGITPGQDGEVICLSNQTNTTITLKEADTNSVAANRFDFHGAGDLAIANDKNVLLFYDGQDSRWHRLNNA